eukprot:3859864-Lingulodinium_polyedra.AAC.1
MALLVLRNGQGKAPSAVRHGCPRHCGNTICCKDAVRNSVRKRAAKKRAWPVCTPVGRHPTEVENNAKGIRRG